MENVSNHLSAMQTEIINIDSSESDDDFDFYFSDDSLDKIFDDETSIQPKTPVMFIDENQETESQVLQHHNVSDRHENNLFSVGVGHTLTPQNEHGNGISNGRFDATKVTHGPQSEMHATKVIHDPQNVLHLQSNPSSNLESDSAVGPSTDTRTSLTLKRTLPSSLQPRTFRPISKPSRSFHGAALAGPHYTAQKRSTQSHATEIFDEHSSSQISEIQEVASSSGKSRLYGPNFNEEQVGELIGINHINDSEKRVLPSHWMGKPANFSNRVAGQPSNFSTKPQYPTLACKADSDHKLSYPSNRIEKLITSENRFYKDSVFLHDNVPATRILPQYPGKSTGNPRLGGSDGGFSGSIEHRLENDEMPIYQEALQNLGQPKLEDDLPEGLLTVSLLKHQKVALAWMVQKEKSVHCAGGILADDQGLGKTISMIALILKQKSLQSKFTSDSSPVKREALNLDDDEGGNEVDVKGIGNHDLGRSHTTSTSENRRPAAGTLVVCPASILRQWAHELEEKVTSSAHLTVLVYHGGARAKDPRTLAKHDIVLTTYSIVTNEVPRQPLVDDDDENEQNNMEKYGLSSEFATSKKRKPSSNVAKKGKKKARDSHIDIGGPLARVRWFRVILDEAQTIKNHRTQVARACSSLRAKRRWCLSGTPMQNAIDDLYSYFRFLKYEPYSLYSSFCNSIKYPISRNASQGYKKLQTVLRIVLLRRTKGTQVNGEPIIKLPPKTINLKNVDFSPDERAFYLKLEGDSRQQFKVYAAAGTVKQNYANILLMLLRLRQACDHPILVRGYCSEAVARDSLEMAKQLPKEMLLNLLYQLEASLAFCPVCNDTPESPVVTMCGHVFCYQCVSERLTGDDNMCPATGCKDILGTDSVFSHSTLKASICDESDDNAASSSSARDESLILQSGYVSSKIRAAMDILSSLANESHPTGLIEHCGDDSNYVKPVKTIIFSQWTGMLDQVEIPLNHSLIQYRRLDGTMSLNARDRAVREFNNDPEVTVMLMSLKAGNLGLNMVAASHIILLDLWWNPTTEDQAIDRAHRIGQTRPVTVSRLTIKDTVEDRILALQEEKRKMVSSAFGEDHSGGSHAARLTMEDLKYLFMI